jgi:hypothetical protein
MSFMDDKLLSRSFQPGHGKRRGRSFPTEKRDENEQLSKSLLL